jgi:hypothetical protein
MRQTGLFSATVAAFILESYQGLLPNSPNTAILSELAAQRVIMARILGIDVPTSSLATAALDSSSRSTSSAIRLNVIWLFSLCISVSCALCAIIMQQWARRFERLCGREIEYTHSPDKKARLRLRLISSVTRHRVPVFINGMMAMLHVAVFLFFIGLIEFMWHLSQTVALAILVLESVFFALYLFFTIFPLFDEVSVFQTPITAAIWKILATLTAIYLSIKSFFDYMRDKSLEKPFWERFEASFKDSPHRFLHEYHNAIDYSFEKKGPTNVSEAELMGLVSTFETLRVKNVARYRESLTDFRTFLVGACSLLSSDNEIEEDDTRSLYAQSISKTLLDCPSTSHPGLFTTWESWLITILRNYQPKNPESVQFTALCMRMHWFMLQHYTRLDTNVFSRLEGWGFFEHQIYSALVKLQAHPRLSVSIAARCFQACLAADMMSGRFEMNDKLSWQFVSAPKSLDVRAFDLSYSCGDRSLIIIMGLVHDVVAAIQARDEARRKREESHRITDADIDIYGDAEEQQLQDVLCATIESMVHQIDSDAPYEPISDEFERFCLAEQPKYHHLGIESALSTILEKLDKDPLPEYITPPTSPEPPTGGALSPVREMPSRENSQVNPGPVAAFRSIAHTVIEIMRKKKDDEARSGDISIELEKGLPVAASSLA